MALDLLQLVKDYPPLARHSQWALFNHISPALPLPSIRVIRNKGKSSGSRASFAQKTCQPKSRSKIPALKRKWLLAD
jgi:hypothetical protein